MNIDSPEIATKREAFKALYRECLTQAHAQFRSDYAWPSEQIPAVCERMFAAMYKGSFNHDSPAFRLLAKRLGIKPTRKAIVAAWEGREQA
jgi:hypothetical protein